jgi:hypothetical protein
VLFEEDCTLRTGTLGTIDTQMMGKFPIEFAAFRSTPYDHHFQLPLGLFPMSDLTVQQLTERLQKLWVQATASCGSATPQLIEEIREHERMLKEEEEKKTP